MKQLLTYILWIFFTLSSFAQKAVNDPYKQWKDHKNKVDKLSKASKYTVKKNKIKCSPFFNITTYKSKDTLILSKANRFEFCMGETYSFYYKYGKLLLVSYYYETWNAQRCGGKDSTYTVDYYMTDTQVLNFAELNTSYVFNKQLFDFLKKEELEMFETLKSDCLKH